MLYVELYSKGVPIWLCVGTANTQTVTGHTGYHVSSLSVSLNESDLAVGSAVPGRSQRGERKRRAGGKGADSAGMVARNRSGQMGQY